MREIRLIAWLSAINGLNSSINAAASAGGPHAAKAKVGSSRSRQSAGSQVRKPRVDRGRPYPRRH